MTPGPRFTVFACLLLLAAAAVPAAATGFAISPIRLELDGGRPTAALTVLNEGDEPVIARARVVSWEQRNGVDTHVETRDVVATPAVLTIDPHSEQVLRVFRRRDVDPTRELSYRLLLEEIPRQSATRAGNLAVALHVSLPIFVAPLAGPAQPRIEWDGRWLTDGSLELQARNLGHAHIQLLNVRVRVEGAEDELQAGPARYLLPGSHAVWTLTAPRMAARPSRVHVHGASDFADFAQDVAIRQSLP